MLIKLCMHVRTVTYVYTCGFSHQSAYLPLCVAKIGTNRTEHLYIQMIA
jgi:hypothetical protein